MQDKTSEGVQDSDCAVMMVIFTDYSAKELTVVVL